MGIPNVILSLRTIVRNHLLTLFPRRTRSKYGFVALLAFVAITILYKIMQTDANTETRPRLKDMNMPGEVERIDWNNYTLMYLESLRAGLGEHGLPFAMELSSEEKNLSAALFQKHSLNAFISNRISPDRSIGDHRYESCKKRLFLRNIPENSVSIVIPFHNEHNSTILRTVHSVIKRSPASLLREVILVDDASTYDYLLRPLEDYVATHFRKVKLIRNEQRLGLMLTRIAGADASSGSFLIFLDAHVEVNYNYLPPLLEPIVMDYKTITAPLIDGIDGDKDFRYTEFGPDRGAFDWTMFYQRLPLLEKDLVDITQPREVPTMMGCAFAISQQWWEEIGKFDRGLKVWGGEQYEIAFKAWQCGGRILDVPCSRVGHVFRKKFHYGIAGEEINMNFLRVATVWMDEYKQYFIQRMPRRLRDRDPGDLKEQFEIRRRLNCKPFKWYMTRVAPDILHNFPLVDPPRPAYGVLQSVADTEQCMTIGPKNEEGLPTMSLGRCDRESKAYVEYSWKNQMKVLSSGKCLVPLSGSLGTSPCSINGTRQKFAWDRISGWIVNFGSGRCLHADLDSLKVDMQPCTDDVTMSWTMKWGHVNTTIVDGYWKNSKQTLMNPGKLHLNQ